MYVAFRRWASLSLLFLFFCIHTGYANTVNRYPIIPLPKKLIERTEYFPIRIGTKIEINDRVGEGALQQLQQATLSLFSLSLKKTKGQAEKGNIVFAFNENLKESGQYTIDIDSGTLLISYGTEQGAFYAVQTILQLMVGNNKIGQERELHIPNVLIEDLPAVGYRGLLLDVARYYMPIDQIKKYIDLMAYYKLNNLHLHLTDDQGWRIEIKKYPKLHQVASKRKESIVGHRLDTPRVYDGVAHEGYYTQKELKELVKYAAVRHVNIIPEIEMPGHSQAVLAAYPQLGCKDTTYQVSTNWSVHKEILCPKEETFEFLQNVLLEVMEIFPSEFLHIGGDESPRDRWEESEFCRELLKEKKLKNFDDLQNYFMHRITSFVVDHGRRPIAWYWDGVHDSSFDNPPIIMPWVEDEPVIEAAKRSQYSIIAKNKYLYFDHYQTEEGREKEPVSIGGFIPLEKVYFFQPVPPELDENQAKYILGVQAALWGEYVPNGEVADYKLFPRLCAFAEIAWSSNEKNYEDFLKRLKTNVKYLDFKEVNYRKESLN